MEGIYFSNKNKKSQKVYPPPRGGGAILVVQQMGDFIFAWTPSTIYNRFARCFGGKLPWFRYTPDKIVQFSKIMKTMGEHLESNDSLNLFEDSIKAMQENNE